MANTINWDRVVAWGEVAEHLNSMLEEGCIGIELKSVGMRDNSFYGVIDGVHKLIEKVDLTVGRIADILPAVTKIEKTVNPGHKFYPADGYRNRAFISIPKHLVNIELEVPEEEDDHDWDWDEDCCPHCGGDL